MTFPTRLLSCAFLGLRLCAADCDLTHVAPIRLMDEADLESKTLWQAKTEAAWVLKSLCVEVDWTPSKESKALNMTILPEPLTTDGPKRALGLSLIDALHGPRGAVFLSRVRQTHQEFAEEVTLPVLLGCVIAHEIAHLLLASGAHSSQGIMKAQFSRADARKAAQRRLLFDRWNRERIMENKGMLGALLRPAN